MFAVNDAVVCVRCLQNLKYMHDVAHLVDQRPARAHSRDCGGLGGRWKIQNGSSISKLQHDSEWFQHKQAAARRVLPLVALCNICGGLHHAGGQFWLFSVEVTDW